MLKLSFKDIFSRFKNAFLSNDLIAVIDIGSSKITVAVARTKGDGLFNVIGYGVSKTRGIAKGEVVDLEELCSSLKIAFEEAQNNSGVRIDEVAVNISGEHLKSITTAAFIELSQFSRDITSEDKNALEEVTEAKLIGPERAIIHKVAYNYLIDNSATVLNPVGMKGKKLSANLHILTGRMGAIDAVLRCVRSLGVEVVDMISDAYASSLAVLSYTEKQMGVVVMDIGGSTTDVAFIEHGSFIYSTVIPIGGYHFTNDIATVLGLDFKNAEYLKRNLNNLISTSNGQDLIEIKLANGVPKEISLGYLKSIIDARSEEILKILFNTDAINFFNVIKAGIIITGGAANTVGLREIIEKKTGAYTKLGLPLTDSYVPEELRTFAGSTVVGLLENSVVKKDYYNSLSKKTMTLNSFFVNIKEVIKSYLK